ncbi:MAG: hypothetical protein KGI64_00480 [Xanthomonadaceae bacterium]|nr:hypothetical protein [Xanthomonadaceae bacterium]MDE1961365.1 hypothetical protein [Xanthomonadaceae bacterium]MDE2083314.1 hypothetical protein [Xanthomonadaceae bacterium]MDE2258014.1 hypothetical protein [Xanthomonadaceae bacterium]
MTALSKFLTVAEIEEAVELAQPVFDRRYRLPVPEFPHHVVALYRRADGTRELACYIHFTDCGDLLLCGGACTDNRVLRRMDEAERDALRAVGGVFQHTLAWSQRHFAPRFAAVFGYTGDTMTQRVIEDLGWVSTPHSHLVVYWLQDVDEDKRRQMIAKAHSFGAF